MNNRTRQWFKANQMLDKYDPPVMATIPYIVKDDSGNVVRKYKELIFFRKSHLEEMKEKYGDDLEVMF